jgi:hypothetical protein
MLRGHRESGAVAVERLCYYHRRSFAMREHMYRLALALSVLCGCSSPADNTSLAEQMPAEALPTEPAPIVTGLLENAKIDEASGIAVSQRRSDLFWVINDDGPPQVHAIDSSGAIQGTLRLADAQNVDWEDLASFRIDDHPYLLVADIGDNQGRRRNLVLYVVAEPDLQLDSNPTLSPVARIEFGFPGGARDAESIAVDAKDERILVLSKRDIPAVLYELPLTLQSGDKLIAKRLGPVDSISQPTRDDIDNAVKRYNWNWQPTAMDISADGLAAVILTYDAVYYFERRAEQGWIDAFRRPHTVVGISQYPEAEAVAFAANKRSIYVTIEKQHAPILRIDLSPE